MRQKTIKAIQEHAAAEYLREACGLVAPRGAERRRYFPCRNPRHRVEKIILCWRRRIMRRLRNGERSPVLFTAILMPPPAERTG